MTFLLSPEFTKDVEKLSTTDRRRVRDALVAFRDEGRGDARKVGEALWRLRVGGYRIYYPVRGDDTYVLRLVHRSRAYRPETINTLLRRIALLESEDS
jgi:mRNA-degrading endonuclease RelE of RelBE toxin-antitoxin system